MALLQISEPEGPQQHTGPRTAIGIDLGTTHSLVATVGDDGCPRCLPDARGQVLLPSIVRFLPHGRWQSGHEAQQHLVLDAANTVSSAKRWMGRGAHDIATGKLPWRFASPPAGQAGAALAVETVDGPKNPVQVSAHILQTLLERAQQHLGAPVDGAVITVPAYFDDAQRQATKDAAQLAGIPLLRLLNEPTAAAIAYGLERSAQGIYAVYDLGGGTFDISILRLSRGVFEVIATGGDSALGGDDYDAALADWLQQQCGVDLPRPQDLALWRLAARACKQALSEEPEALFHAALSLGAVQRPVHRSELAAATAALTTRTLDVVRRTLADARLTPGAVQGVVLVGGATRMPQVRQAVADFFAQPPLTDLNPDEVVALGAAIQARQLAGGGTHDLLLLDVTPLSLGLETMGGVVERIVERNEPIPCAREQTFTTFQDGQTALALHVVQGERELAADCRSLARFELRGIPPMNAGAARIRVRFALDADGLLSVSAREETCGVQARVLVKPSWGLADADVARMLQEGFAHAAEDARGRTLAQARVDAGRLLHATSSALAADGDLLDARERAVLDALMQALHTLLAAQDARAEALEAATRALAQGSEAFAAARMNRSIRQALSGKSVQSL